MHGVNYKLHIGITACVMAIIFVQSALPGDVSGAESNFFVQWLQKITDADPEVLSLVIRKGAHFTEYMILGGCLGVNVRDWFLMRRARLPVFLCGAAAWAAGTLYAITDEVHQAFVPDRACALMDVGIDSAGVLAGVVLILAVSLQNKT